MIRSMFVRERMVGTLSRMCSTEPQRRAEKPVRKIMKLRDKRPIVQKQRKVNHEHEMKAAEMGLGWRVMGASILHRYPVITRTPEKWEEDMQQLQDKIAAKQREHLMESIGGTDAQFIPETVPSVQDMIDSLPFTPASRTTEADLSNDMKSMDRSLERSLFMVVKRNRTDNAWQFPQGKWNEGESMRMVSERVGDRAVGKIRRWYVSNAPIGHYCYAYPEAVQLQRKQYGAKVFFYRAQHISGRIKLETRLYKDYAWIGRDEVDQYFDQDLSEYMKELLIE